MGIRKVVMAALVSTALVVAVPTPASAEDIEIGGPCAEKDIVIIVPNPVNDDVIKVCANHPI